MVRPEELTTNLIFDGLAATRSVDLGADRASRLKDEMIRKYLKPTDTVLDVGCANGTHVRSAAHCKEFYGVDISEPMIREARKLFPNAHFDLQSATELNFPNENFDLVMAYSTLVMVPDLDKALREISRVTKPGGVVLLNLDNLWTLQHLYWKRCYRKIGHFGLHGSTHGAHVKRFQSLGLDMIESHASGFLDQWRYVPGLHLAKSIDGWLRRTDIDYTVSNLPVFYQLANQWHFACRRI